MVMIPKFEHFPVGKDDFSMYAAYLSLLFIGRLFICVSSLNVVRNLLPKAHLLSISPRENFDKTELLYIPSAVSLHTSNSAGYALQDESFVSLLSDRGYPIHSLDMSGNDYAVTSVVDCLQFAIAHLSETTKSLVIVANELSCLDILRCMGENLSGKVYGKVQISGAILIDPPPIHSVVTERRRQLILSKYFPSLYDHLKIVLESDKSMEKVELSLSGSCSGTLENGDTFQNLDDSFEEDMRIYEEEVMAAWGKSVAKGVRNLTKRPPNKRKRYFQSLKRHYNSASPVQSTTFNGLNQVEENNRILTELQSGSLLSMHLLGERISEQSRWLGSNNILVIGRDGELINNSATENTGLLSAEMYDADNWGSASLREFASLVSSHAVQFIPQKADNSRNVEDGEPKFLFNEETYQNEELARIIDTFVRQLNF